MKQKIQLFLIFCANLLTLNQTVAQTCLIPAIRATLVDSCGKAKLTLRGMIDNNGNGPVEYIVVSSSGAAATQVFSTTACSDTQRLFSVNDSVRTLTLACASPTVTISYRVFLSTGTICGPFTLNVPITKQQIGVCDSCARDIAPPLFTSCPVYKDILTDKDSIPFSDIVSPTIRDNCDPNPVVTVVSGAKPFLSDFLTVIYEAKDRSNNKSRCTIDYRLFKKKCLDRQTCIILPRGFRIQTSSDYIVVVSSGSSAADYNVAAGSTKICFPDTIPFYFQLFLNSSRTISDRLLVNPCTACDFDTIPPKFTTCPQNITTTTATDCATATWTTPTATDNCSTPSVKTTSTRLSGACFPLGTTAVVYTATDSTRNTATCSFSITVNKQALCKSYDVFYTNNVCACEDTRWQPYGFYLESANGCPADLFKPTEGVRFQTNSDKTATLKGQFRNNRTWELVVVDVIVSGQTTTAPTGSPNLTFCQRGRSNAVAATWQYFTGMSGTVKTDAKTLTINRLGTAFQIGVGANNQNIDLMGASGRFTLSDGRTGNFGLILTNEVSFECGSLPNAANDIQVSLTTDSPNFVRFATLDYTVSVKNTGSTTMKNAIVEFRFPSGTVNGGTVTPSVGTWQEWCAGNIQCFQWTIPTLAAGSGGTLKVPVFVSGGDAAIAATAKLLASSPIDGNAANNQATVTVTSITRSQGGSAVQQLVQLIPVVIQKAFPNPTDTELNIQLNSLDSREVAFEISNSMGQILKNERVNLKKGANKVLLDVSALPSGIYFVTPRSNAMRNVPVKFIKM